MLLNTFLFLAALTAPLPQAAAPRKLAVSFQQAQELSQRIWMNECAGKIEGLTSWNEGEEFASLGIGHFIWYPANKHQTFKETFPELLAFLKSCGVTPPAWISIEKGCPWRSRDRFQMSQDTSKMEQLREFLYQTRTLQAVFIAKRLEEALPKMTGKLELSEKRKVEKHFYALAQSSKGLYALIDYLNFKGEGVSRLETYNDKGWGLLQVLQRIPEKSILPLEDFVKAAKDVLEERVKNAPAGKNERRWLKGWYARLNTYLQ